MIYIEGETRGPVYQPAREITIDADSLFIYINLK
jgi:hypothetical protein